MCNFVLSSSKKYYKCLADLVRRYRPLLCMCILSASQLNAAVYYVSNSGNDSFSGMDSRTAWATVAHINAHTFSPGDSVLFQRGGTWKDAALTPGQSGTAGKPITFGAYGTGALPVLDQTTTVSGFTVAGPANVWHVGVTCLPPAP